jgi:hypothetical protein
MNEPQPQRSEPQDYGFGPMGRLQPPPATEQHAVENTDRELWREREGDYYADSIHVTKGGGIGINCGGHVYVKPLREWHRLATKQPPATEPNEYPNPTESDLKDPDFEAVWNAIKEWDLSRYRETKSGHRLYSGASGNDVMHILLALKHSASQLPEQPPATEQQWTQIAREAAWEFERLTADGRICDHPKLVALIESAITTALAAKAKELDQQYRRLALLAAQAAIAEHNDFADPHYQIKHVDLSALDKHVAEKTKPLVDALEEIAQCGYKDADTLRMIARKRLDDALPKVKEAK